MKALKYHNIRKRSRNQPNTIVLEKLRNPINSNGNQSSCKINKTVSFLFNVLTISQLSVIQWRLFLKFPKCWLSFLNYRQNLVLYQITTYLFKRWINPEYFGYILHVKRNKIGDNSSIKLRETKKSDRQTIQKCSQKCNVWSNKNSRIHWISILIWKRYIYAANRIATADRNRAVWQ